MNGPIVFTKEIAKTLLPKRPQNSNKGSFGNVLNIAGSINYRGAAALSTISALKMGAGYVSLATIEPVIKSVCKLCPETVFVPLEEKNGTIFGQEYKKYWISCQNIKLFLLGVVFHHKTKLMKKSNVLYKTFLTI